MASELSAKPQGIPVKGSVGYEKRDASAWGIFAVVAFLAVAALTIHLILAGMVNTMKEHPKAGDIRRLSNNSASATTMSAPVEGANVPRLQLSDSADLEAFCSKEETELHSYGWVNKTAGIVRVPVERAMELVLERGLPIRQSNGTNSPGPSELELQQQRQAQSGVK